MKKDDKILHDLVAEVFVDKRDVVIRTLQKRELDDCIIRAINAVDNADNIQSLSDKTFVSSLSSSFLTNINTRVGKIADQEEKEKVEYMVGELSKQVLVRVINRSKSPANEILKYITSGLKTACLINGWNYSELSKIMSFDLLHSIAATDSVKNLVEENPKKNGICFYAWNGENEEDLKDLAYNLKDRKTIKSTAEFRKLFAKHDGKLKVRFDSSHLDFVIVLFDELNTKGLIKPKGEKAKHFTPLKAYAIDFEKELLIKTEPKHIKYRISRNKVNHTILKGMANKWIQGYKTKS